MTLDSWLVIGQSRHEIYLRFATCPPEEYREYLKTGRVVSEEAWLLSKPYGPWVITRASEMEKYCTDILVFDTCGESGELSSSEEDKWMLIDYTPQLASLHSSGLHVLRTPYSSNI